MGSSVNKSKNPTTQTSTPKFVEKVAVEIMQVDKADELFQTMVIMNLNMGKLNLQVSSWKNRLATKEKEKVIL